MTWTSPAEAMPWVGLYTCVASLVCTLAMAADVFLGFRQWKLWFPCRYFTINAASITLIAISMKLPVDLSTDMTYQNEKESRAKSVSLTFLVIMLANILPSLGVMNDNELLLNTVALCILMLTIIVNMLIQYISAYSLISGIMITIELFILLIIWPISVVLTVSTSRGVLQQRYKELHILAANHPEMKFSSKGLLQYVKKYWMILMTETGNPQFTIACSAVSFVFGVICSYIALASFFILIWEFDDISNFGNDASDYKWSIRLIIILQLIGVIVGSIAPIFRSLTATTHFNLSKKWSKNHLNVFRVEKHWTQTLQLWKSSHVPSIIPGYHCKKSSLKRFIKKEPLVSDSNMTSDIKEYSSYVLQVEPDAKLSKRILRNALNSITRLLHDSEEKEPRDLLKLLEKSTIFYGVVVFQNDQVPHLHLEDIQNCWSLVAITLTAIALALPETSNAHIKGLLASMTQGLQIVRHVEERLNANDDLIKSRKASGRVWTDVEIHCKWLQIDLQKKARKGKTSQEILRWLGDEAVKIVIQFKRRKNVSMDQSLPTFIAASSMYRVSQTILLHFNEQENWPTDEELFEFISTIIADMLCACFTNLPRVITMKCHEDAIEKREDSIRIAAQLLGRSKKILKMLKARQIPNLDMDSMAYIDKWHALLKNQIFNGCSSATI